MHRHVHSIIAGSIALSWVAACGDEEAVTQIPDLVIATPSLPSASEGVDYQVQVSAEGGTEADFRWSLASGRLPSGVFLRSEGTPSTVIAGRPKTGGTFSFVLRVRDSDGNEAIQDYEIQVAEAPPEVEIQTSMLPQGSITQAYDAPIEAENGTGYVWRVVSGQLPPGLQIEAAGTPATRIFGQPTEIGRYSFTVRVEDAAGNRDSAQYSVEIIDDRDPLEITEVNITPASVGVAYRFDLLQATGGSMRAYTWKVLDGGELPPGLTLAEEGTPNTVISGVPAAEGSFSFRVEVRDDEGNFARRAFFMTVGPRPPPLRITTFELPSGRVDEGYAATVSAIGGGSDEHAYVWSVESGMLPPGLSITQGTPAMTLEGTPSQDGSFTFELRAETPVDFAIQRYTVLIEEALLPLAITATAAQGGVLILPNAEGGQSYNATLEATGGAPLPANAPASEVRYNWVMTGGELPPGITLEPAGAAGLGYRGIFGGVPSALGTYTATVTVYDRLNNTASQVVRITVDPPTEPLTITTTALGALAINGCDAVTVTAQGGGNTGYEWDITAGSLPAGFSLTAQGTPSTSISGANAAPAGTYPVTIRVTDSFGLTAFQSFDLVVDANKAGNDRWAYIVGEMDTDGQNDLYVSDLCGERPSLPVRVNQASSGVDIQYSTYNYPKISPAKNALAYIQSEGGRDDVYVLDLQGPPSTASGVRVYTGADTSREAYMVHWSPDGTKLGIITDHTSSGAYELWVADVQNPGSPGTAVRVSQQATSSSLDVYFYSSSYGPNVEFSPDGTMVAWVGSFDSSSRYEIWFSRNTGGSWSAPAKIHATPSNNSMDVNGHFRWTPDSRGIVFHADFETYLEDQIFFSDIFGAGPAGPYTATRISPDATWTYPTELNFGPTYEPHWGFNPQGTRFAFISDAGGAQYNDDVYVMDYAAGIFSNLRQVTNRTIGSSGGADDFKWSPDGSKILIRGDLRDLTSEEIYVADVTGALPINLSNPLKRAPTTVRESSFSFFSDYVWSPGSNRAGIIGDYDQDGSEEAWVVDITGATPYPSYKVHQDTSNTAEDINEIQFSPGGGYVAVQGDPRSNQDSVYVSDISTLPPPYVGRSIDQRPLSDGNLDISNNLGYYDDEWYWVGEGRLVYKIESVNGKYEPWFVDVTAATGEWTPAPMYGPGQMTGSGQDIGYIGR